MILCRFCLGVCCVVFFWTVNYGGHFDTYRLLFEISCWNCRCCYLVCKHNVYEQFDYWTCIMYRRILMILVRSIPEINVLTGINIISYANLRSFFFTREFFEFIFAVWLFVRLSVSGIKFLCSLHSTFPHSLYCSYAILQPARLANV
jgi:hypothetical protein